MTNVPQGGPNYRPDPTKVENPMDSQLEEKHVFPERYAINNLQDKLNSIATAAANNPAWANFTPTELSNKIFQALETIVDRTGPDAFTNQITETRDRVTKTEENES